MRYQQRQKRAMATTTSCILFGYEIKASYYLQFYKHARRLFDLYGNNIENHRYGYYVTIPIENKEKFEKLVGWGFERAKAYRYSIEKKFLDWIIDNDNKEIIIRAPHTIIEN